MAPADIESGGAFMIHAVIFDLDNTLYDFDTPHRVALDAMVAFAERAAGIAPERFQALQREAFDLQRRRCGDCGAVHNRLIRCQLMLELAGKPIGPAPAMAGLYWSTLLEHMRPLPGAAETIDRLRAMGLAVGVGTNMTADYQFAKLERLGLLERIDFLVTSEEAGAEKPDPRLFQLCAEKAGCAPGECAFVGDSLKGDALGARDAGMRAVWLCREPGKEVPDGVARIFSLDELPDLLTPS